MFRTDMPDYPLLLLKEAWERFPLNMMLGRWWSDALMTACAFVVSSHA
jgi:hypothetical protein